MEVKFNGCEHLDFSDHYTATKEPFIQVTETKVLWNRPVIDPSYPSLVQFCKRRGRLNSPTACLCAMDKRCSDYTEHEHVVTIAENSLATPSTAH